MPWVPFATLPDLISTNPEGSAQARQEWRDFYNMASHYLSNGVDAVKPRRPNVIRLTGVPEASMSGRQYSQRLNAAVVDAVCFGPNRFGRRLTRVGTPTGAADDTVDKAVATEKRVSRA